MCTRRPIGTGTNAIFEIDFAILAPACVLPKRLAVRDGRRPAWPLRIRNDVFQGSANQVLELQHDPKHVLPCFAAFPFGAASLARRRSQSRFSPPHATIRSAPMAEVPRSPISRR